LISIIIPVFNGERYIVQAVSSAINQTYEKKEIIVVDDGSWDKTPQILRDIEGITVITKKNGGTGSALNAGIKQAKGNWIKWLSSDDILYTDALERMLAHISKIPDHKNCIFYTSYDIIDKDGKFIKHYLEKPHSNPMVRMMQSFYGNASTSLIHKAVFKKIGLFKELPHSEDYEFWLRAIYRGVRMELIPQYTIQYRMHPDQLTNQVGGSLDVEIKKPYA